MQKSITENDLSEFYLIRILELASFFMTKAVVQIGLPT